jgi:pyruvate dehydrogenase E2 component (dihydrolipoamide acetyltransferase)
MPQMGYDMREGTVVKWRKQEGEPVTRGEVIAEIETDKATVEMEAYSTGVLGRIVAEEGRTVPVGDLIAVITEPGEAVPAAEELTRGQPAPTPPAQAAAAPAPAPAPSAAPAPAPAGEIRATPIARRLAREKGIDLVQVTGTGPGGRITEADVLAYEDGAKAAPVPPMTTAPTAAPAERIELTRMRRAIAAVTVQSKRETPHFYITAEIDMTQAMALRRQINDALQDGTRVSVNDMIVKAATKTLETFPKFNASFQEDHLQIHPDINIGIAIALDEGLIVPAIMGCQNKSLAEIARASGDLGQRAQGGTLRTEEYTGSTFSISNLGMFGAIDSFAAIIFPPNAAVLAVGTVKEQPVVREGQITVAQIMKGTISVDHRVADGAEGAQFLMELKRHLENPVSLLL